MKVYILVGLIAVAFGMPANFWDPFMNEGLFEGDILISDNKQRNGAPLDSERWLNGVVPYAISPELNEEKPLYLKAFQNIESATCIRFVERTNEENFVWIYNGTGCSADRGQKGGNQTISLGPGCNNLYTVLHEVGHALGFGHEHNRSDRDDYLIINWENIKDDYRYAFEKHLPGGDRLFTWFDYQSVMLYGSGYFAKDPDKYSMVRKDGTYVKTSYDRTSMSDWDFVKINSLYKCFEQ